MVTPSFGVSRNFDTTLERLWRAFTDGGELAKWVPPKSAIVFRSELDVLVAGSYRFGVETADGVAVWCALDVKRLEPPALVTFTHQFTDEAGKPSRNPLDPEWPSQIKGEIRCALQGGGATVTINLAPLEPCETEAAAFRRSFAAMSDGWERALDRLDAQLNASPTGL